MNIPPIGPSSQQPTGPDPTKPVKPLTQPATGPDPKAYSDQMFAYLKNPSSSQAQLKEAYTFMQCAINGKEYTSTSKPSITFSFDKQNPMDPNNLSRGMLVVCSRFIDSAPPNHTLSSFLAINKTLSGTLPHFSQNPKINVDFSNVNAALLRVPHR